jgi:hypothetical protein
LRMWTRQSSLIHAFSSEVDAGSHSNKFTQIA